MRKDYTTSVPKTVVLSTLLRSCGASKGWPYFFAKATMCPTWFDYAHPEPDEEVEGWRSRKLAERSKKDAGQEGYRK